ncbi:hypothetical protein KVR01_003671 [Diaporthe batatas]|uniref:uncharacterized protein n=1 Tax=Diaporthe batatas TaxID=748121 RepID=UPI001D041333|nr:uncharacterized protein KVR01_003671 [Diaporthe batatas]KAG8167982.1 hypothetical protein KVR01_003671 [Diaporthe batatas]
MDATNPVRGQSSWLTILSRLDNIPYPDQEDRKSCGGIFNHYWDFLLQEETQSHFVTVGHITDWLVNKVHWDRHPRFTIDRDSKAINLDASTGSEGTKALHALIMELLDGGGIAGFDQLHRKNDCCQIPSPFDSVKVDRNAAQLFGIVTMGSHMNCYTRVPSEEGSRMMLWVPRRASNKKYDAGKLDNTVAGGITNGDSPLQTILAEAEEEAALSPDFVTENIKTTSILTYYNQCPAAEGGHLRPRVLHTYELELPPDLLPRPRDGEVDEFLLMDAEELREAIMAGEMTDDAAIVWLDFLVRHCIVDEQNEPGLLHITDRMHRHLPFSTSCNGRGR